MAYSHKFSRRKFSSGQYDREFSSQENAIQASGMLYARNLFSSHQGEAKTRPGTEHKLALGGQSVIVPFRREQHDIALVFSAGALDLYDFDADGNMVPFQMSTTENVVWSNTSNTSPADHTVSINGDISGDTAIAYKWWTKSSYELLSDYTNNRLYIPTQTYPTTNFNMRFTAKKALSKISIALIWADGNYSAEHLNQTRNWIKDAVLQYSDNGEDWTTLRLAAPASFTNKRFNTPSGERPVPVLNFVASLTDKHEYWRVVITWDRSQATNNAPFIALFTGGVQEDKITAYQSLSSPYDEEQLKRLKYSQNYNELYICDGVHKPYVFSLAGATPTFQEKSYDFINTDGVPSCVRFFQGRLYYGGFAAFPTRVRGSRFAGTDMQAYSDFTVLTDNAGPADPVASDCNQFSERITDLWGGFTILYAQSPDGIAFLENGTSTPSFTLRCSERAAGITPTMKDNIMFYVGYDRRKIHAFSFDNHLQQFVAPDVSLYWQEVLKNRINEIHYVDSRNNNIIGILDDGTAFSMLYDGRESGFLPFDVGGFIYDAVVLKVNDNEECFFVVNRNENWVVEKVHQAEFMERTNAFEQSAWERNLATQENLKKTPFFDAWRKFSNEQETLWSFDTEANTVQPLTVSDNPIDLEPYIGKYVRFYYGNGIRDYVDLKILEAYTEQQTIEKEITVVVEKTWYAWENVAGINVSPVSGRSESGYWERAAGSDGDVAFPSFGTAWKQGNNLRWTSSYKYPPNVGDSMYYEAGRGMVSCATITSVSKSALWTESRNPVAGDPVYNENLVQIGTVAVGGTSITYNGKTYSYASNANKTTSETHTRIETVVVEGGQYLVDDVKNLDSQVFNKIQLPIESINVPYETVQIQDNGVYKGTFKAKNGVVEFDEPMYDIQYGIPYRKIGVVEDNRAYLRQKQWGAVAVNVIDTLALKVGSRLDKMTEVIKITGTQFFDSNILMKNGTLIVNISDTPEYEKKLIFMTDEGLPFTILAIENDGNISDRGAN